ncbi:Non-classical export protein 2 [Cytospora mali]|uniref:Non-classical export protein 2 n=1 Tax=Cytospora mali TaxID=578113 RepID=A0A194W8I5_CYTMA|nr:Non-classical export protein 2 [Valsa mali]
MEIIQIAIRALQLLLIVLLTGLLGNVIASNNNGSFVSTSGVNFSMFVTALAWVVTLYGLAVSFIGALAIPIVVLACDVLAVLFTLIDGIVLAALLGVPNCGSTGDKHKCRELQASTAFMWFLFLTFVVSLVFAFMSFKRGGGSVRSGPGMTQVRV